MPDPAPNPNPDPNPNPNPNPAPPWHTGVDPETIGFWQNKGYDLTDQKALALKLTEQYRAAEKHIGVPPDQLIRLPKDATDAAGWDGVYQRLNVPKEAKEYDLSNVKRASGDLDPAFADALRAGMLKGRVPKDQAPEVAKIVIKALDDADAQRDVVYKAKVDGEMAQLKKDWGTNFDFNRLKAMEGARKLGIEQDAIVALESIKGGPAALEALRRIGQNTSEDFFIEGNRGPGGNPSTREGAISKKAELLADKDWGKRYTAGGMKEKQEMTALNIMIDGDA